MNQTLPNPSDREQRLQEVLADYMQAAEAGQSPDRQELLGRHPDLADELASFFANRDAFAQRAGRVAPPPARRRRLAWTDQPPPRPSAIACVTSATTRSLEEIARGGMGVVFKARQVSLNRVVALKMILAGQLASPRTCSASSTKRRPRPTSTTRTSCPSTRSVSTRGSILLA